MAVVGSRLSTFLEVLDTPEDALQALREEGLLLEQAQDEIVLSLIRDSMKTVEAAIAAQGFTFSATSTSIAAALFYGNVLSPKGLEWNVSYSELAQEKNAHRDDSIAFISLLLCAGGMLTRSGPSPHAAGLWIGFFGTTLSLLGSGYLLLRSKTWKHAGFGLIAGLCSFLTLIQILNRLVQ